MSSKVLACIEQHGKDAWMYTHKYIRAAEELLTLVREHNLPIDSIAQPIAFLYRHALELAIKGFIISGNRFVTGLTRQRDGHNLATLLENADLFIARYSERLETAETAEFNSKHNALRTLVKQIQYIDPTSESFRYATDRKGKQTLATTQYLDLQDFAVQINDAISFLGFIASEFERQIDCREN